MAEVKGVKNTFNMPDRFIELVGQTSSADKSESDLSLDLLYPNYLLPNTVLAEGFLFKRGKWNPAWKSRYFVLEVGGRLSYFLSKIDKDCQERAKGIILIDVNATVNETGTSDGHNTFKIHIPGQGLGLGRTYVVGSETVKERDLWVSLLSATKAKVRYVALPRKDRFKSV